MQTYKTLADVIRLAEFAHFNQTDQAGMPYIEHPRRVMKSVQAQGAMPFVQMAAILHDVTEDTAFTPNMLRELGVPEAAVALVELLDRDHSKENWETDRFISDAAGSLTADEYYYRSIKRVPEARMIKLADIADNTLHWRLSYLPEKRQEYLRNKYDKALALLR